MKWSATFEAITITPESPEDRDLLYALHEALSSKAEKFYQFGEIEFNDEDEVQLTLVR